MIFNDIWHKYHSWYFKIVSKLRLTISKYHSWYLCQISLHIMLLPILTGGRKLRNSEKIEGSWDSTVYPSFEKKYKLKQMAFLRQEYGKYKDCYMTCNRQQIKWIPCSRDRLEIRHYFPKKYGNCFFFTLQTCFELNLVNLTILYGKKLIIWNKSVTFFKRFFSV